MPKPDSAAAVPEIEGTQFAFQSGRLYSMTALALAATAVLFLVSSFGSGFGRRELLVILGSVLSLPVLFLYPLLTPRDGRPPSGGIRRMLIGLGAVLAYGLGCYLTFYEGLWGLGRLFGEFSLSALLWSLVCCVLGFAVVNGLYRLTQLCRAVDEGRIIVRSSH